MRLVLFDQMHGVDGTRENGHLNESDNMKVEIEELEHGLLGPEESEVDTIVMNAKGEKASQGLCTGSE